MSCRIPSTALCSLVLNYQGPGCVWFQGGRSFSLNLTCLRPEASQCPRDDWSKPEKRDYVSSAHVPPPVTPDSRKHQCGMSVVMIADEALGLVICHSQFKSTVVVIREWLFFSFLSFFFISPVFLRFFTEIFKYKQQFFIHFPTC